MIRNTNGANAAKISNVLLPLHRGILPRYCQVMVNDVPSAAFLPSRRINAARSARIPIRKFKLAWNQNPDFFVSSNCHTEPTYFSNNMSNLLATFLHDEKYDFLANKDEFRERMSVHMELLTIINGFLLVE